MEQIDNVENSVYNNFCFHVVSTQPSTKITQIVPTVRARKFLFMANSENWTFHLTSSDRLNLIALAIELCYEWMEISALQLIASIVSDCFLDYMAGWVDYEYDWLVLLSVGNAFDLVRSVQFYILSELLIKCTYCY